jgi:hypothetical protein
VVDTGRATRERCRDLVVDRVDAAGELLGGDALLARSSEQDRLVSLRDPGGSGPTSTVRLSMLTRPTSGWRRPAMSTSALSEKARRQPSP